MSRRLFLLGLAMLIASGVAALVGLAHAAFTSDPSMYLGNRTLETAGPSVGLLVLGAMLSLSIILLSLSGGALLFARAPRLGS